MFWTGVAVGCFIGAAFGVLIMALVVAGKESDERMIVNAYCQKCDVLKDPEADGAHCLSCKKGESHGD